MQTRDEVQHRYWAAVDSLVAKLEQDRYVLAAILYGSLARGEAWERSDIDMMIILQDGRDLGIRGGSRLSLTEDGIAIEAEIMQRSSFRRHAEGALQGGFAHAIRSHCKLLFCRDESIAAWLNESKHIGQRDQAFQLMHVAEGIPYLTDKVEKWLNVRQDVEYSIVWLLYLVNTLAQVEMVLQGEAPQREVIQQALKVNPAFFKAIYTDIIHGPKTREAIQQALNRIQDYVDTHVEHLYQPVLDYLEDANGVRSLSDINLYFSKKTSIRDMGYVLDWLARKGLIEKVSAPLRLTKKSRVTLLEPAYFFDAGLQDWE